MHRVSDRSRLPAMLGLFVLADMALFLLFGGIVLNQMEFTGLRVLWENPDAVPFALSEEPEHITFRMRDYFMNCTIWCLLEDVILTCMYGLRLRRDTERIEKRTDIVYFWMIHINIKIFLNIHSTASFLSALEYARESRWREYGSPEFSIPEEAFFSLALPDDWFVKGRCSLLMCLCTMLIVFCGFLHYPKLKEKPALLWLFSLLTLMMFPLWNPGLSAKMKIMTAVVLLAVFFLGLMAGKFLFSRYRNSRKERTGKINLHSGWIRKFSVFFIGFTVLWAFLTMFIFKKENPNSLFGIQYSAILKLIVPLLLLFGILLEKTEQSHPEKYIQHSSNLYQYNVLTLILTGCMALMIFSEFGSVVCILALTMLMFLLFVDFQETNLFAVTGKILYSAGIGGIIGICIIMTENAGLQWLMNSAGLHLEGNIGNFRLDSELCFCLGIVCAVVLLFIFLLNLKLLFIAPVPDNQKTVHFFPMRIQFLNTLESISGKMTKPFRKLHEKNTAYFQQRKSELVNPQKQLPRKRLLVSVMIPATGFLLLYYNFFLNAYSGTTVLKNFYMTAGNFSSEFEITEDITNLRARQTACAKALQENGTSDSDEEESAEIPSEFQDALAEQSASEKNIQDYFIPKDKVRTLEELQSSFGYSTEIYSDKTFLRILRIIDRLCYSSRTSELSAVQKGLKQNMGFDTQTTRNHRTYISTLQDKSFLRRSDLENASPEVRSAYYQEDGRTLKEEFRFLNLNGELPKDKDDTEYVWHYGTAEQTFGIRYDDDSVSVSKIPVREWQRIFCSAEAGTAGSDYVLYTLSKLGIGNVLLLIFIPYFFMIVLLLATNQNIPLTGTAGRIRYVLHHLGTLYVISFTVQTIVIVGGVFGVSLFSGLSLPLIASGNFEMFLNSIAVASILISVGDPGMAETEERQKGAFS